MVLGALTARIFSIERCAASSLSFSIFSNAATSGFVLQMGGWVRNKSWAPAAAAAEIVSKPSRHRFLIRIEGPEVIEGQSIRAGRTRGRRIHTVFERPAH